MRSFIRSHLTYANVTASLALFVALGGVGYAAATLPKNSVGTAQIKNSAVTGAKVKNSSLTGADIKDKSLKPADFDGAVQGPQGIQGPAGPSGVKGDTGATGAFGPIVTRSIIGPDTANGNQTSSIAACQASEIAVGGGGFLSGGSSGTSTIQASRPFRALRDANGTVTGTADSTTGTNSADMWGVTATNNSGATRNLVVFVLCVARPG
jgi:hypothetical protein